MKQIEVTILGQSYRLVCPEDGEASLREAVGIVDQEMTDIRDAGKVKARERMAVLAALNLAYRLADQARADQGAPRRALDRDGESGGANPSPLDAPMADDVANDTIARLVARVDQALGADGHLL